MRFALLSLLVAATPAAAASPDPVTALAYHPKGAMLAAGLKGEVRLFDPAGAETGRLGGLTGRVTALAFDSAGKSLAVVAGEAGKSGVVGLYSVGDGKVGEPVTFPAHRDSVYALAFSPDGRLLATAGYDRVIHLWAVPAAGAKPVRTLTDHSDTVYSLAFSPDGKLLASAAADRAVKVWDVATGTRLYTLGDPTDWVYAVAWHPDGKRLAAAGVDKSIRVWAADRDGGKLTNSVFAHDGPVLKLAFSADGSTLYSAGEDRVVKAWDAKTLTETRVFDRRPDSILSMALRPDGKQLSLGRFDGALELIDTATGKPTAQPLPAKPKPPQGSGAAPVFAHRGATTKVIFTGKDLADVRQITGGPGVTAKVLSAAAERVEAEVTAAANAPVGPAPFTLVSEGGKSAPVPFVVDRFPAVAERGVTDSARSAMAVKLPATVGGSIDRAGDEDFYRFEAAAGQQIGVQVLAAELGSKLSPVVVLTDAGGKVLAEGTTLLGFTAPAAGTYALGVRDRDYNGGTGMTYRLHAGPIPVVTGVFPLGVQRGKTAEVRVDGVNLPPAARTVKVAVPETAAVGSRVPVPLPAAGEAPLGSASVVVGEFPTASGTDPLAAPATADGLLTAPDAFGVARFAAKKGERLVVEVHARRIGSPLDPALEILDAAGKPVPRAVLRCTAKTNVTFRDHDSEKPGIRLDAWNELGIDDLLYVNGEVVKILALPKGPDDDCQFYQEGGKRAGWLGTTPTFHAMGTPMYKVEAHPPGRTFPPNGLPVFALACRNDDGGGTFGKDSVVFFDPPADGVYQARVTDARGEGGPHHAYRLTVRPPRPDFAVSLSPSAPAVWKGGAVPVTVTATRTDGFDGPIEVSLAGLPPGFSAPPTVIEGNLNSTAVALFAEPTATVPPNAAPVRVVANAVVNGKPVTKESAGGVPKAVEPGDIVTTTRQAAVVLKPGGETRLVVDVERRNGFKGRIPLEVRGLPHGVRVLSIGLNGILVTERDTSREVVLYAEPWVKPAPHPLVVLARREGKNTEHAAKSVLLTVEK